MKIEEWEKIPCYALGSTPEDEDARPYRLITVKRALLASYEDSESDPECGIVDTLADLRHLCDALGLDFATLDQRAYKIYSKEAHDWRGHDSV